MEENLQKLKNKVKKGEVSHAYLFFGDHSDVVFDFALSFSQLILNCEKKDDIRLSPNFLLIDSKNDDSIKVQDVRNLKRFITLSSSSGFGVAVIKDAEKLNASSANAILKLLEEPPSKKVIILTTKNQDALLPTILSRVEKIGVFTKSKKYVILNEDNIKDLLKVLTSNLSDNFDFIEKISKKDDIDSILDDWILFFRDLLYVKNNCDDLILLSDYLGEIKKVSQKYSNHDIVKILDQLMLSRENIKNTNINSRLLLEGLILNL